MDGITTKSNNNNNTVIVLAATNQIEKIDEALLRPGRFDQIITFNKPNKISRKEIFENYLNKLSVYYFF